MKEVKYYIIDHVLDKKRKPWPSGSFSRILEILTEQFPFKSAWSGPETTALFSPWGLTSVYCCLRPFMVNFSSTETFGYFWRLLCFTAFLYRRLRLLHRAVYISLTMLTERSAARLYAGWPDVVDCITASLQIHSVCSGQSIRWLVSPRNNKISSVSRCFKPKVRISSQSEWFYY